MAHNPPYGSGAGSHSCACCRRIVPAYVAMCPSCNDRTYGSQTVPTLATPDAAWLDRLVTAFIGGNA